MKRLLPALVLSAALAVAPRISNAQTAPDPHHPGPAAAAPPAPSPAQLGAMGDDMPRMMAMMHGGGMMGGMPFRHIEGRLAFLKTELKITSAQEPQWATFADAVRSVAKTAQGMMPSMMMGGTPPPNATERLARYEKMLTVRLEAVRTVRAAFDPLYGSLSDEQKRMADELLASPMGVM